MLMLVAGVVVVFVVLVPLFSSSFTATATALPNCKRCVECSCTVCTMAVTRMVRACTRAVSTDRANHLIGEGSGNAVC